MQDFSLGVVIVAFNSGREITDCAETLLASAAAAGVRLRVALVDNASTDDTAAGIPAWASGAVPWEAPDDLPFTPQPVPKPLAFAAGGPDLAADPTTEVGLIHSRANRGFAGGVNLGLAWLAQFPETQAMWVLNPDTVTPPEALAALAAHLPQAGPYSLMGGRVTYLDDPGKIQIDGGTLNKRTGVTGNLHLGDPAASTPEPRAADLDFITGASMIASRAFYEAAGPMREDYFLYYEEVDWALRRGDLPLATCPGLRVYHRAGTAIGSPTLDRLASPFSLYFKHRGRMRFVRRFLPGARASAQAYSLAYAARLMIRHRAFAHARAVLSGAFDSRPPPEVRARITGAAAEYAFASARD